MAGHSGQSAVENTRDALAGLATSLTELKARTDDHERAIARIHTDLQQNRAEMSAGFEKLQNALADKSKTPWGVIASFASVFLIALGVISAMALGPRDEKLKDTRDLYSSIMHETVPEIYRKMERIEEKVVTRQELADKFFVLQKQEDELSTRLSRIELARPSSQNQWPATTTH
jgi:chromosome segregation ATPase